MERSRYREIIKVPAFFRFFVGSLTAGKLTVRKPIQVAFFAEAAFGLTIIGVAFTNDLWAVSLLIGIAGVFSPFTDVPMLTAIQQRIKKPSIGTVFSFWGTAGAAGAALGTLAFGSLLTFLPVRYGFLAGGLILISLGLCGGVWVQRQGRTTDSHLFPSGKSS